MSYFSNKEILVKEKKHEMGVMRVIREDVKIDLAVKIFRDEARIDLNGVAFCPTSIPVSTSAKTTSSVTLNVRENTAKILNNKTTNGLITIFMFSPISFKIIPLN